MKTLITLFQTQSINELSPYVDGFIIGHQAFGTRLTHSFSIDEIKNMIDAAGKLNKEIFLMANQMMTDDHLDHFVLWLSEFTKDSFHGIVCADLGVVKKLSDLGWANQLIYNPETLMTNAYDFNFFNRLNIQGVYVAKEITLEDIKKIGQEKTLKLFMVGHGHLNMFYSKRQLIKNYADYIDIPEEFHERQDLRLVEETRAGIEYPILEDHAGTHVFRANVFSSLSHLDELEPLVDYFVIDTLFKSDTYGKIVAQGYQEKNIQMKEHVEQTYHETWDEGFFFKKTIYKGKTSES